jgi:adenylyl-sulfate reductase (glutathione)
MLVMYAPWCPFCQGLEPDYTQVAQDLGGGSLRVAKYNADHDREYAGELGLVTFPTIVFMPKENDKVRARPLLLCGVGPVCAWSSGLRRLSGPRGLLVCAS